MTKRFKIDASEMRQLTDLPGYCYATDQITVDGRPVGYMYREHPGSEQDSGWRFFSGLESDEEANDPSRLGLYRLNTIANYDMTILPLLDSPYGTAFGKDMSGVFIQESFDPPAD